MEEKLEDILLTFVVPCYNVERYVQRCLDSIYACDLPEEHFEVLCINDASPDDTQTVLEACQGEHSNLRIVVHEQNKGLGGARNTGIREARGKYLWFVDSDDSVEVTDFRRIAENAESQAFDVLCFNYRRVDDSGKELSVHQVFQPKEAQDGYAFVNSTFGNTVVFHMGYVWRFLYRREYLLERHLFFPEHVCWEDTVFMPKALLEAERVAAVSDVLYSYRVNAESISGVFDRVYPARLIFEFAFCAGADLLRFSDEVNDESLKNAFRDMAIQKYINGFPIHLFRTSFEERKAFYMLLAGRKAEVEELKVNMKFVSKALLWPVAGPVLASLGSIVYGLKHQKK